MIKTYQELIACVNYLQSILKDSGGFVQVQQVYTTPHFACLSMRFRGKTLWFNIGKGTFTEGFWLSDEKPPVRLRVDDPFNRYVRKHIRNRKVSGFELIDKYKSILLKLSDGDFFFLYWERKKLYFALAENKNDSFFIQSNENELNYKKFDSKEAFFHYFKLLKVQVWEDIEEKSYNYDEDNSAILNYFEPRAITPKASIQKSKNKKVQNIKSDYLRVKEWKNLQSFLDKNEEIPALLEIGHWTFKFFKGETFHEKRDKIFNKIKNLKKAEPFLKKRLDELESKNKNAKKDEIIQFDRKVVKPGVPQRANKHEGSKVLAKDLGFQKLILNNVIHGAIGKDARGNDQLRNKYASKNDIWFHLEGYTSGHVILKLSSMSDVTVDIVEVIGSLLRDRSSMDILTIPIVYTQVKYLKSVKSSPGKVRIKKEKHLLVNYRNDWEENLSFPSL